MSGHKPTLGYPSRTAAVVALRGQRLGTTEIAARIGIEPKTVIALEVSASRSKTRAEGSRTVLFSIDLLDRLSPHAARRGVSANTLARQIVETVLDDGIVDAVLDDKGDMP